MTAAYIAFGGNLGDPAQRYSEVAAQLRDHPAVSEVRTSRLYRTAAVGNDEAGTEYINGVLEVLTSLSAMQLFEWMHEAELRHGRRRDGHWAARTIDLDLLLFGESILETKDLAVPHPRMHYRRFVVDPLAELARDVQHPVLQLRAKELQRRLQSEVVIWYVVGDAHHANSLASAMESLRIARDVRPFSPKDLAVSRLYCNEASALALAESSDPMLQQPCWLVLTQDVSVHPGRANSRRIPVVDCRANAWGDVADHFRFLAQSLQPPSVIS